MLTGDGSVQAVGVRNLLNVADFKDQLGFKNIKMATGMLTG